MEDTAYTLSATNLLSGFNDTDGDTLSMGQGDSLKPTFWQRSALRLKPPNLAVNPPVVPQSSTQCPTPATRR
ncbi:MAG: hypothetical protein HY785_25135 [Oscillatoriophycideae cyanobacterium NC_groundwater_1537_Pr4_S-0.65um_50_18]|nr:hypothetical protein [Oscillatoriophycideae cyanobacterium NC_groundwater_1537_Pr4_S-0.65um_50_18]